MPWSLLTAVQNASSAVLPLPPCLAIQRHRINRYSCSFVSASASASSKSLSSRLLHLPLAPCNPGIHKCPSSSIFSLSKSLMTTSNTQCTTMDDLSESINNQTQVAFTIANHLLSKNVNSAANNLVFSPLSLHLLLSIIAAGSKGPTRDQVLSFLRSNSTHHLNSVASHVVSHVLSDATPAGGPRLSFASGAWLDESLSLKPSFKQLVNDRYKAVLASELGLVLPFECGDLTEMVVGQELYVSSIYHKSFIEVNEEGTEAAAASAMVLTGSSCPQFQTEIDFVADHPFLFVVREDLTGTVLFIGQVLNPLDNSC